MKLLITCSTWGILRHLIQNFTIAFDVALHHEIHRITEAALHQVPRSPHMVLFCVQKVQEYTKRRLSCWTVTVFKLS